MRGCLKILLAKFEVTPTRLPLKSLDRRATVFVGPRRASRGRSGWVPRRFAGADGVFRTAEVGGIKATHLSASPSGVLTPRRDDA